MDNMTFEQAEQLLTTAQKDRIARCLWEELKLPQGLNQVEKAFAFGLYTFVQYEDRGALRQYFAPEEGQPGPGACRPCPGGTARFAAARGPAAACSRCPAAGTDPGNYHAKNRDPPGCVCGKH